MLFAAFLHAGWNSIVKVGLDRASTVLLLAVFQAVIALPLLPFVDPPDVQAWPWIVGSALLHVGYKLFLIQAYRHADLSQAYPLARGTAPLLVTLYSLLVLGVEFDPQSIASVIVISTGILVMATKGCSLGSMQGHALFYALATAGFTAAYTLVDGVGARVAGSPSGFILAMVVLDAILMIVFAFCAKGPKTFANLEKEWRTGFVAGAMSLGSYWIAVWAFTHAPIALVAALRETSILFATLIAFFLLHEPVSRWRWISVSTIAIGVMIMRF